MPEKKNGRKFVQNAVLIVKSAALCTTIFLSHKARERGQFMSMNSLCWHSVGIRDWIYFYGSANRIEFIYKVHLTQNDYDLFVILCAYESGSKYQENEVNRTQNENKFILKRG